MKRLILMMAVVLLTAACGSATKNGSVSDSAKNGSAELEFKKEGFVSRERYIIVIIKPSDTNYTESEIVDQLKNRALSSIQKYLMDNGKTISPKAKSSILNIVNDYGKMKKVANTAESRTIYVYEITHDNLKSIIDGL